MIEVKKNNTLVLGFNGILLNPKTFMKIAYGQDCFYTRRYFPYIKGITVALGSKVGHAGNGCMPGLTAVTATVESVDQIKPGLYRYKLKDIDVFEPVKIKQVFPNSTFILDTETLNYLDDTDNSQWLETYFYPHIKGAYVSYLGEWVVPEPEYV